MIFVRGGLLGEAHTLELTRRFLTDGPTVAICINRVDEEPDRVLDIVIRHSKVCLTTDELLHQPAVTLEHTREYNEPTHWTAWLKDEPVKDEDFEARCQRVSAAVRSMFLGPVEKEVARDRAAAADFRGLQPPSG